MNRLPLALLLALSLAACDKSRAEKAPPTAAKPIALQATRIPSDAMKPAAATATPTEIAPLAKADGQHSCGNEEMKDGQCAGGCNQFDAAAAEVGKRTVPADASWTTIAVEGMHCGGCERRIVANLGQVDGVLGVTADAELGQVRVAHAKGNDRVLATAREHINSLGYVAK